MSQGMLEEEDLCSVRMLPEAELLSKVQGMSQLRLGTSLGLARNASSSQALDKKKMPPTSRGVNK